MHMHMCMCMHMSLHVHVACCACGYIPVHTYTLRHTYPCMLLMVAAFGTYGCRLMKYPLFLNDLLRSSSCSGLAREHLEKASAQVDDTGPSPLTPHPSPTPPCPYSAPCNLHAHLICGGCCGDAPTSFVVGWCIAADALRAWHRRGRV